MAIFHCYVSSPEGIREIRFVPILGRCEEMKKKTGILSIKHGGSKLLNQQTWGIYEEIWGCWPSLRGTLRQDGDLINLIQQNWDVAITTRDTTNRTNPKWRSCQNFWQDDFLIFRRSQAMAPSDLPSVSRWLDHGSCGSKGQSGGTPKHPKSWGVLQSWGFLKSWGIPQVTMGFNMFQYLE